MATKPDVDRTAWLKSTTKPDFSTDFLGWHGCGSRHGPHNNNGFSIARTQKEVAQ